MLLSACHFTSWEPPCPCNRGNPILKNILLQANLQLTALFMLHQSCLCRYPPSPVLCCCCRYHYCIALWGIYADVMSSACLPRNRFTYYWFNTKLSDIPKNSCVLFYRTKQHVNVEFRTQTECYFLHWDTTDTKSMLCTYSMAVTVIFFLLFCLFV